MNDFPFTDADLTAAALAVSESMLNSLPEPDEIEHEFSDSFLEKMDVLIARDRQNRRRKSIARRAAMIALAVLLSIGAWMTVDADARATFARWIKEIYENHTIYFFHDSQDREDEGAKLPDLAVTWLPDGFALKSSDTNETGHFDVYENDLTGEEVFFMYHFAQSGFTPMIVYNYDDKNVQETVTVHGIIADYYPADSDSIENTLVWIDESNGVWLELSSSLSKEMILQIAESIS